MADKKPPIDTSMETQRAKRINSLHRSVNDIVQQQNQKRLQVSNEISSLTKEQQKLMNQLELEKTKFTNETASAYNGVVNNLGKAIQSLSVGVKDISTETAKATTSAISQYSKAVGEDISINRENTIAMALSRATPLFGYFAAKFMETDVFQGAASRIKESVTGALRSTGESVIDIFRKKEKAEEEASIPHMQVGGYVEKSGLAEVHAAEVVSPIEKLPTILEQSVGGKEMIGKLSEIIDKLDEIQLADDFRNKLSIEVQRETATAIKELKVSMVGTVSQLQIMWQRTLLEHPVFKNLLMFSQTLHTAFVTPFKFLFGVRGGYAGDIRRATATNSVFQQQINLLALIYANGMRFLRNIEKYTKVTAEALVGEEVSPVTSKKYTIFGKVKEFMTGTAPKKEGKSVSMFEKFADFLEVDKKALKEAGMTGFADMLKPRQLIKNMGFTLENILRKAGMSDLYDKYKYKAEDVKFDKEIKPRAKRKQSEYKKEKFKKGAKEFYNNVVEKLSSLVKMKKDQEEREGPHSPSMAENIANTAITAKDSFKHNFKNEKEKQNKLGEIKKNAKQQTTLLGRVSGGVKRMIKKMTGWFPIIFGFLTKTITGTLGMIGKGVTTIAGWALGPILIGMRKILFNLPAKIIKKLGKFLGGGFGKLTKNIAGTAGKFAGGARGALGYVARGATKIAGTAAAATGGLVIGGVMSLADAIRAIMNPEEFVGGIFTRGLAGFLGGTGTGIKGMAHGAMKGGAIGAAIGSVVPGLGTALGGGIGALAGGILGFVGGPKLSEAIKNTMDSVKDVISGIWQVVKFPFQVIHRLTQSAWILMKFAAKSIAEKIDSWLSGPDFVGKIWSGIKGFFKELFSPLKDLVSKDFMKKMKQFIADSIFANPLLIVKVYKKIGQMIDEWLMKQPVVGRIYKKVKRGIKSIRSGDMSASLERALEGKPESLTEAQIDKMTAKEIAEFYAKEESAKEKAARNRTEEQTEKLNKEREKQTKTQVGATVTSAQIISNNNTNQVNNNSGGTWGGGWNAFSSNGASADRVAKCDIN